MSESIGDFWKQAKALATRSRAEADETKAIVESISSYGGKWRFVGVRDGIHWMARHKLHGDIRALSAAALIEEVKRINEREAQRSQRKG